MNNLHLNSIYYFSMPFSTYPLHQLTELIKPIMVFFKPKFHHFYNQKSKIKTWLRFTINTYLKSFISNWRCNLKDKCWHLANIHTVKFLKTRILKFFKIENNIHITNYRLKKHPNVVNKNIYKFIHTTVKIMVKYW